MSDYKRIFRECFVGYPTGEKLLVSMCILSVVFFTSSAIAGTIYVKSNASGSNNGTSWTNAYSNLQNGLTTAQTGDEIWVAAGDYKPSAKVGGTTDRYKTFQMKNGVGIYGGFSGSETSRNQRNWEVNSTVLNGDVGIQDDKTDNCYHVFYHPQGKNLDATAILDGFTIKNGNANGSGGNGEDAAGGIYNYQCSPTIKNCTFKNNIAYSYGGYGGAVYNHQGNPRFENCLFDNNEDINGAGAVYNYGSSAEFINCSFMSNSGNACGGIHNNSSNVTIRQCVFTENSSNFNSGGGIHNNASSPSIVDSVFYKNYGGGIYNYNSSLTLNNCLFVENSSTANGGAISFEYATSTNIINCSFYGNFAKYGGSIYSSTSFGNTIMANCILWGNTASLSGSEIYNNGNIALSFSNIDGGINGSKCAGGALVDNGNNINLNPKFADYSNPKGMDGVFRTKDDGFHLLNGSPCIDVGSNSANSETSDLAGEPRIQNGTIDMGAYEGGVDTFDAVFQSATNGSLNGILNQKVLGSCSSAPVTAVGDVGYHLVDWTGDITSTDNPLTLTNVTTNMSVTANFAINQYTITFVEGANGTITGEKVQTVTHGTDCTEVTAVPNTGYHFVNWTGNYSGTDNPLSITNVTTNMTITANFAINTHTLTYTAGANGSLTGETSQTVEYGASGTPVTAVADGNYHFVDWSDGSTDNPRTDTNVISNITVTANFAINQYTVTFFEGANGTITGEKVQTVTHGTVCTKVTAVPNTGYHFVDWTGDLTSTDNPLTLTNVTTNMSVTANFSINQYTITFVEGANGTITGEKVQTVNHGASCSEITAVPKNGYFFSGWTGTGGFTSNENPLTLENVIKAMTVSANFLPVFTVTFIEGANGAITGEKVQIVNQGTDCKPVTAAPNENYHFVNWTGDYEGTENPITISSVTKNMDITANFARDTAELTMAVLPPSAGTSDPTGTTTVDTATAIPITATSAEGYHFSEWTAEPAGNVTFGELAGTPAYLPAIKSGFNSPQSKDGSAVKNASTATATLSGDATITANFEINTYTVTFQTDGTHGASIIGEPAQTVEHGGECSTVTAVPPEGWNFKNWSGGVTSTDNPLVVTNVTSDMTITANFEIQQFTVSFISSGNGEIFGNANQIVPYGGKTESVTVESDKEYYFTGWTGDYSGNESPLIISNVTHKMTITANFAAVQANVQLTVISSPLQGGTTNPSGTSTVNTGDLISISATPESGYNFLNWSVTANGTIGDTNSVTTTVLLLADSTVTANFAQTQGAVNLTMTVSPAEGGSTSPTGTSTVSTGEPQAITATASEGHYFVNWSADNAGAVFGNASSTETTVTVNSDTFVTANFAELPGDTDMAYGRIYATNAVSAGLADFAKAPTVYAQYVDPVKGGKAKKASLKVLGKIVKGVYPAFVNCEWKGSITLFNKKLWDKTLTCEENLAELGEIEPLTTHLFVSGMDSSGKKVKDQDTQIDLILVLPEITGVYDAQGNEVFSVLAGDIITIRGTFFGSKPPIVWMEYPVYDDAGNVNEIKALKLKVSKVLKYPDAKNTPGKSCMDVETGLSEITVFVPEKWPKGWDHSEYHNIVIDNKVGRATIPFQTEE